MLSRAPRCNPLIFSAPRFPLPLAFPALHRHTSRRATNRATADEEEIAAARSWLGSFTPDSIPRSICDVTFSRSSGPGGQNVNKVNSKATLRVPLDQLLPTLPTLLHSSIRASRYYAAKSDCLVIQADESRKQNDNVHSCFQRLFSMIAELGKDALPGETSEEQKARVKGLQEAHNEARLKSKKTHSSKKSGRRSKAGPDY